jgi:hypothetical protein
MSSSGEMKMSLKLMTCEKVRHCRGLCPFPALSITHVLMLQVLEELQFTVCAL